MTKRPKLFDHLMRVVCMLTSTLLEFYLLSLTGLCGVERPAQVACGLKHMAKFHDIEATTDSWSSM
jgi:hypothetical protein